MTVRENVERVDEGVDRGQHWTRRPAASSTTRSVVLPLVIALLLVTVAAAVGVALSASGSRLYLDAPPLFATWMPHVGPGTPAAIGSAIVGLVLLRRPTARMRWSRLLPLSYFGALAWTVSLTFVDLGSRPWAAPLGERDEYLNDLPRLTDLPTFLSTFTDHILDFRPGSWTTHVSSHPPLATMVFWGLDRVGLGGQTWAGIAVILVGCTVAVSVPVTLRALGAAGAARAIVPFVIFLPGSVWIGTSADGMFAGVLAAGIVCVAWGSTRRSTWVSIPVALAGGVLLGGTLYLSYGLAVAVLPVLAVCWCSRRVVRRRGGSTRSWSAAWVTAVVGVAAVALCFFLGGFNWFAGLSLLRTRYYQGIASSRPYGYFVWANLAALVLSAGPAIAPALTAAARSVGTGQPIRSARPGRSVRPIRSLVTGIRGVAGGPALRPGRAAPALLSLASLAAVVIADLSGLSKAETERIWLPFGVWLLCGVAALPRRWRERLLLAQMATALLVNHLLLTHW